MYHQIRTALRQIDRGRVEVWSLTKRLDQNCDSQGRGDLEDSVQGRCDQQ
jgi:hypothetical protein